MKLFVISLLIFPISLTRCRDSQSNEINGIKVTPFYNTIILSDIADIINEFDNNINQPSDMNSESDFDENMEDLLSEYQHYLDKAHKQKQIYIEKSKTKNKVPLSRREKFMKMKNNAYKNDSFKSNYLNSNLLQFSQTNYNNPLDLFIPLNLKPRYPIKSHVSSEAKDNNIHLDKTTVTQNRIIDLPAAHKSLDQIESSGCCNTNQLPWDTNNCKQCWSAFKPYIGNNFDFKMSENKKYFHKPDNKVEGFFKAPQDSIVNRINSIPDNTINLRIKLDISLPRTPDYYGQNVLDIKNENDKDFSKETLSSMNMPLSYYNIPIETDMFGYKNILQISKPDSTSLHKMTIHKKKKSRVNNGNKKHHKKVITFHNINLDPHQFFNTRNENNDIHNRSNNNISNTNVQSISPNVTEKTPIIWITHIPNDTVSMNNNQIHEEINFKVNITKNEDKTTEDNRKNENSIENDYTTKINLGSHKFNLSSEKPINLRLKRNLAYINFTNSNDTQVSKVLKIPKKTKKNEKMLLMDAVLLYWPNNFRNHSNDQRKNITAIILMRENKKSKLNISKETLRINHTQALEQAIFGEVDWNDVDTVAPTFISFIGKYITGVLTFCSEIICHSMKCGGKACVYRVCAPEERLNNIGHCPGSDNTDSVATMESIMDLPSNVAFEIVDILQDRMLGKIFGKMTLCITSKCISMATYKKIFKQNKCTAKELYSSGHCPDIFI